MNKTNRKPTIPIAPMILHRWSARAMNSQPVSQNQLLALFEAARWAPSSGNSQPWRFIYAHRDTPAFKRMFDLLADGNKIWCQHAAVLIVIVSRKTIEHNHQPSPTHSFDTGAAWQNLALQGTHMGLVIHAMAGFDYERAQTALNIPNDFAVEAMIAIGHPGNPKDLPEKLQKRETPSDRKTLSEIIFHEKYANKTNPV